jgi:uncharacterized small protein (DUF1192 family)
MENDMKKVTLREYAKLHKLSYFNVMKMAKGGDVKSIIEMVDGKEIEYILIEEEQEKRVSQSIIETSAQKLTLKEENALLKKEIERLKVELEKCNKRTILA